MREYSSLALDLLQDDLRNQYSEDIYNLDILNVLNKIYLLDEREHKNLIIRVEQEEIDSTANIVDHTGGPSLLLLIKSLFVIENIHYVETLILH